MNKSKNELPNHVVRRETKERIFSFLELIPDIFHGCFLTLISKKKKRRLQTDGEALEKKADDLALEAETKRKVEILVQSNTLRKESRKKKNEAETVDKQLDDKLKNLKDK